MHLVLVLCLAIAVRGAPQESDVKKASGETSSVDAEKAAGIGLNVAAVKDEGETSNVDAEKAGGIRLNLGAMKDAGETSSIDVDKAADKTLKDGGEKYVDEKSNTEEEESSNVQDTSVLAYSIHSYAFEMPKGLYREVMYTNDWTWFLKYPQYSMDFHYYCPYQIEDGKDLEPGDLHLCFSTVKLYYWSKAHEREILLDIYNVTWADGTEDLVEKSVVISESHEESHTVALAMRHEICKEMKYTITSTFEVIPSVRDIDCESVKTLKKKNDKWALDNLPELAELDKQGNDQSGDAKSTKERLAIAATEGLSTARSVTAVDLSNYIKSLIATVSSTEPDGSVISSNYKLPKGLYKEFPIANNWVSITADSLYFLNYLFYCPYELKLHTNVVTRKIGFSGCQPVIQLSKYSEKFKKDIILDSFNVKQRYITMQLIDAIKVHGVDGEKTEVVLQLVDNKCSKNTYELQTDGTVKREEIEITCPEKEPEESVKTEEVAKTA